MVIRELVLFPSQPYVEPDSTVYLGSNIIDVTPNFTLPGDYPVVTPRPIPIKFYFVEKRVSCDIVKVNIAPNGQMEVDDKASNASWLSQAPWVAPGEIGNSIIAGHVTYAGVKGTFSILKELSIGEVLAVGFEGGYTKYFEVVSVTEHKYNDSSIMTSDSNGEAIMTLITCKGDFNSSLGSSETRVVAVCKPIDHK
ncbi:MAG: class F sortase [Clostridia bacterium]